MTALKRPAPRLFVPLPLSEAALVPLSPEQTHYLRNVMRRDEGEQVAVFNGADGEWQGTIVKAGKKQFAARLDRLLRPQSADSRPDVWLLFAPVKKHGIDIVVEKATELGSAVLWPILTARTMAARINGERLHAQAVEAAEQCERLNIPRILPPCPLEKTLKEWDEKRLLYVLDETGSGAPPHTLLAAAGSAPAAFLVGPEGGFSHSELDLLRHTSFVRLMSLGPRILRAETAAIAALTCWQALCGDWKTPPALRR